MQALFSPIGNSPEHHVRVLLVSLQLCLHLLAFLVQTSELLLKVIEHPSHLRRQADVVLGSNILFDWQLHPYFFNSRSFLSFQAIQRFEEKTLSPIVGDIIDNSLFDSNAGDYLEIDE